MHVEYLVEQGVAGATEVFRENLPQCHFVHHSGRLTTNHSNYGMATFHKPLNSVISTTQNITTAYHVSLLECTYWTGMASLATA
jgi:hypothetical protein